MPPIVPVIKKPESSGIEVYSGTNEEKLAPLLLSKIDGNASDCKIIFNPDTNDINLIG